MNYLSPFILKSNHWNNALSFDARIEKFWDAKITIPSLKKISSTQEIQLWHEIVLEEINDSWKIFQSIWLQNIYELDHDIPIYIFDNHNHALYFWINHISSLNITSQITLLHIDQHSDMNVPWNVISKNVITDPTELRKYVNLECQISNFIVPFTQLFPSTNIQRIKSESELLSYTLEKNGFTIIDIDLDFWAPEMSSEYKTTTINLVKNLVNKADIVTIASSPLFLEQEYALELLNIIFE